jgi:hypothetical protein
MVGLGIGWRGRGVSSGGGGASLGLGKEDPPLLGQKSVKDWEKNWLREVMQLQRVRKPQFRRVFHLEGESGRNYKMTERF